MRPNFISKFFQKNCFFYYAVMILEPYTKF